jgi:hypothetical protein
VLRILSVCLISPSTKVFAKIRIIKRCNRVSFDYYQGDQMSLWRNRPKCRPANVLPKLIHNFYHEKVAQKLGLPLYVILIKLQKVIYCPIVENSPNLVTLMYIQPRFEETVYKLWNLRRIRFKFSRRKVESASRSPKHFRGKKPVERKKSFSKKIGKKSSQLWEATLTVCACHTYVHWQLRQILTWHSAVVRHLAVNIKQRQSYT